ncbi:speckle-type POZ protein-like [Parasteatoda tepidariorum]|uniref:speckle-type POZ protein-like n=1 Tax=Parasteatoda tepidariorum TaxID=114398 RepID=UPI0039BD41A6
MSHKPPKSFSFTWKIANFPNCYQQNANEIASPSFMAECLGGSKWYLELYPRGVDEESIDFISCFLIREGDCSFNGNITVDYTLQVIGISGEIIETFQEKNIKFDQGDSNGCEKFFEFNKIVNILKEQNEDTLTIRSIISLGDEVKMATACVVHSKINCDRYSFKWSVEFNNSNLPEQERIFILGELQFKISLGTSVVNDLAIDVSLIECNYAVPCLVVCQISFLNQRGVPESAFHGNHLFRSKNEIWDLPSFINLDELDSSENIYMTDEMFVMLFDFSGSNDVVSETIPSYTYDTSNNADSLSVLQSDFRELFVSKKHADVIFRTGNQDLPVHKTVLIARSPVFSTMFDQNMIEKQTGIVDIVDVDVETLKSFLEYLYTGSVEKLNYESAVKLFSVAEKYQVQSLIDECYEFLLTVLSQKNVCELIYVADIVNHACLKKAAMDYIAAHTKEILISPEWSRWSEKNLKLTSEIFLYIASNCDITLKKMV